MNIQYYGNSCFKITTKPAGRATEEVVIFFDPFEKSIGLRPPQGKADLVLVSHSHFDHNNVSALRGEPMAIDTPGEYSIKGINIVGIGTWHDNKEGALRGPNTVFILESEDIKLCHLGDLGEDLDPEKFEEIDGVDILFVPAGGKYTIDAKKASEISRKIEPKIIIPMHYKINGMSTDLDDEKKFCHEMGSCPKEKTSKLTIKSKDLDSQEMKIILMEISS